MVKNILDLLILVTIVYSATAIPTPAPAGGVCPDGSSCGLPSLCGSGDICVPSNPEAEYSLYTSPFCADGSPCPQDGKCSGGGACLAPMAVPNSGATAPVQAKTEPIQNVRLPPSFLFHFFSPLDPSQNLLREC